MKLVTITNGSHGTILQTTSTSTTQAKSMRHVIDSLCLYYGSTLKGREAAVRVWLNKERMVPIFVNPDCILILSASIRRYETIAFNYFALDELTKHDKIQAFLATKRGKKSLEYCRWISEKMSQDYDIMSYLKGTFHNA
jgi:ComK protein.